MNTTVHPRFEATPPAAVHVQKNSEAPNGERAFASMFAVSQADAQAHGAAAHDAPPIRRDAPSVAGKPAAHARASRAAERHVPSAAGAHSHAAPVESDARPLQLEEASATAPRHAVADAPAHESVAIDDSAAPPQGRPPVGLAAQDSASPSLLARAMQRLQMLAQAVSGESRDLAAPPAQPESVGGFAPMALGEAANELGTVDVDDAWLTNMAPAWSDDAASDVPVASATPAATTPTFDVPQVPTAATAAPRGAEPSFDGSVDAETDVDTEPLGALDDGSEMPEAAPLPMRPAEGQPATAAAHTAHSSATAAAYSAHSSAKAARAASAAVAARHMVAADARRRASLGAEADAAKVAAQSAQVELFGQAPQANAATDEVMPPEVAADTDVVAQRGEDASRDEPMQLDARMAAEQAMDNRFAAPADDAEPTATPERGEAVASASTRPASTTARKQVAATAVPIRDVPDDVAREASAVADAAVAQDTPAMATLAAAQGARAQDDETREASPLSAEQAMALGTARAWLEPHHSGQAPAEQAASFGVERQERSTDDVLASMAWQGMMAGAGARTTDNAEPSTHAERGAFALPQGFTPVASEPLARDASPLAALAAARVPGDELAMPATAEEEDIDAFGSRAFDVAQQAGTAASQMAQADRAQGANGAAPTAPAAPPIAAHEMSEELAQSVGIGHRNIRLQVAAPGVGELAVDVRVVEGRVQMRVAGDADGLATTLRQQGEQLQASLASRGLTLESLDFRGGQAGDTLARQQGEQGHRQEDRASAREAQDFERLLGPRGTPHLAQLTPTGGARRGDEQVIYVRA